MSHGPSSPVVRLADALRRWPMRFLGMSMLLAVAINIANVIGRYAFRTPIFWAEEILVYLMIWSVFMGLPAIILDNAQLRMDLGYNLMPGPLRRGVDALITLVSLACAGFGLYYSWQVVSLLGANKQVSVAAGAPMALVHSALLLGFALMLLALAVEPFVHREAPPAGKDAAT